MELIRLKQYHKNFHLKVRSPAQLMTNILALMSINWVFLFAVTYGKYGWDVG